MRKTQSYAISRRRLPTGEWISRESRRGSTRGKGQSIASHDFNIVVSGDFAFCHGYYRLGGTPKSAGRPVSFWMRATVCLHRDGGAWRIVHEHESVPFYMDGSLRPAFDLKP
jgi:hypothetical protein